MDLNNIRFQFNDGVIIDNELWFSNINYPGIYKLNILDGSVALVMKFDDKLHYNEKIIIKIFHYNHKLYLFSQNTYAVFVYDMMNSSLKKYSILSPENIVFIRDVIQLGTKFFLMPYNLNNKLVCYDGETNELVMKPSFSEMCSLPKEIHSGATFRYQVVRELIYFPIINSNYLGVINLYEESAEVLFLEKSCKLFSLGAKEDDLYCTMAAASKIIKKDLNTGVEAMIFELEEEQTETPFSAVFIAEKKIFALPKDLTKITVIDKETYQSEFLDIDVMKAEINLEEKSSLCKGYIVTDGKLIIFPWKAKNIIILDLNNNQLDYIKISITNYERYRILSKGIIYEDDTHSLPLLANILDGEPNVLDEGKPEAGDMIHHYVRNRMDNSFE